jgi:hypothetical protein
MTFAQKLLRRATALPADKAKQITARIIVVF